MVVGATKFPRYDPGLRLPREAPVTTEAGGAVEVVTVTATIVIGSELAP